MVSLNVSLHSPDVSGEVLVVMSPVMCDTGHVTREGCVWWL